MHLDLRHERIVGGGCPLLRDQIDPPPFKMAISSLYSLVAPQP